MDETFSVMARIPIREDKKAGEYIEASYKLDAISKMSEKLMELLRISSPRGLTIWITESTVPGIGYVKPANWYEYVISAKVMAVTEVRQQVIEYKTMGGFVLAASAMGEIKERIRRKIARLFGKWTP